VSRNGSHQASIEDVDARLSRSFSFREKYKLTLFGEAFNVFNHQQFTAYTRRIFAQWNHGHLSGDIWNSQCRR
jgi:hypothetical protein